MQLSKYHKVLFVTQAMNDVPQRDFPELIRQEIKRQAEVIRKLHGLEKIDNTRLNSTYPCAVFYQLDRTIPNVSQCVYGLTHGEAEVISNSPEIAKLKQEYHTQFQQRNELRAKLAATLANCHTRKAVLEVLPEFEKYLPPEPDKLDRSVPVVANVVTAFVKAGWPKDGKKLKAAPSLKAEDIKNAVAQAA